ncbi:Uncharacterized protein ABC855_g155 [[Candida] zeylanoides]
MAPSRHQHSSSGPVRSYPSQPSPPALGETLGTTPPIHPAMTDDDVERILNAFLLASDVALGVSVPDSLAVATRIWHEAFAATPEASTPLAALQTQLVRHRKQFAVLLMNHRDYNAYERLVLTLYRTHAAFAAVTPSWTERVCGIIKLQGDAFDADGVERFLGDAAQPLDDRRFVLMTVVERGLLYTNDAPAFVAFFLRQYPHLEGGAERLHCGIHVYKRALNLLVSVPRIAEVVEELFSDEPHGDVVSALLQSAAQFHQSKVALSLFRYQVRLQAARPHDLTHVMQALLDAHQYAKTIEMYHEWASLRDDSQIAILLEIAERERDWKALQRQFEDMYGRGTLPHRVHYAIVMNALASIGAREEVRTLFNQLSRRNLAPDADIVAALARSELYYGDFDACSRLVERYSAFSSQYWHQLVFGFFFRSNDLAGAMAWFERVRATPHLVNAAALRSLLGLCRRNYAVKELEAVWRFVTTTPSIRDTITLDIYCEVIKAYTKLSLHHEADAVATAALTKSAHPHLLGKVLACKAANYRQWLQHDRYLSVHQRDMLHAQIGAVAQLYAHHRVLPQTAWFAERIRYHTFCDNLEEATRVLRHVGDECPRDVLNEKHYHPLMHYHFQRGNYNAVLELFKEMTTRDVAVSVMSHYWLMRALLRLDRIKKTAYANSTNLLRAVYDMHGLALDARTQPLASKVPRAQLYKNAAVLANITMEYVVQKNEPAGSELLFGFLEQIRARTGDKVTAAFKYPFYREIYHFYVNQGNAAGAAKVVDTIYEDLVHTTTQYVADLRSVRGDEPAVVPHGLSRHLQFFVAVKLDAFRYSPRAVATVSQVSRTSFECGLAFSNHTYNRLVVVLASVPRHSRLCAAAWREALRTCESRLVRGSWMLVSLERAKRLVLMALVHYLSTNTSVATLQHRYALLLRFYRVQAAHLGGFSARHGGDRTRALEEALASYNRRFSDKDAVTVQGLLDRDFEFFSPPEPHANHLVIAPATGHTLHRQWTKLRPRLAPDAVQELAREFPHTLEYLHLVPARMYSHYRLMKEVDRLEPPPISDVSESARSRHDRVQRVLRALQDQHHPERTFAP